MVNPYNTAIQLLTERLSMKSPSVLQDGHHWSQIITCMRLRRQLPTDGRLAFRAQILKLDIPLTLLGENTRFFSRKQSSFQTAHPSVSFRVLLIVDSFCRFLMESLPAEILALFLQSCDDFPEVITFTLTCKRIHNVWISHAPAIIWRVGLQCMPGFDSALMAVCQLFGSSRNASEGFEPKRKF